MENEKCICLMRTMIQAIRQLETDLIELSDCDLNQAMTLCVINKGPISATEIAHNIGLLPAHTSKLLSLIENKGWIKRTFGQEDKRKTFFSLTPAGEKKLNILKNLDLNIPDILLPYVKNDASK